jgi:hypothetical protein
MINPTTAQIICQKIISGREPKGREDERVLRLQIEQTSAQDIKALCT